MKLSAVTSAALVAVTGLLACTVVSADTLKKIADTGKITLAYRESSVPFSYLAGPGACLWGSAVDISNAVVDAVKKRLNNPAIKVELQAVTSQNRIPLLTNGTIDLECGSTTNNTARAKDVQFAINLLLYRHAPADQEDLGREELRRSGQEESGQHFGHHQCPGDPQIQPRPQPGPGHRAGQGP